MGGATAVASPNMLLENISNRPVLTIAHITDVHIRAEEGAPSRFTNCLEEIKKHKIDFFLNGGDSIMAADYDHVTREKTLEYWTIWDQCLQTIADYEVYSCIGNHDTWWAAPSKQDPMYGKYYVVQRLKIPNRYYSFVKKGWHFFVLDGNQPGIALDQEQFEWLETSLKALPKHSPAMVMSHYPILGTTPILVGGGHSDFKALKNLFYQHQDKVKLCLSGHQHLLDHTVYNGVQYCCNGSMSGFWWGKGDKESAGDYYYQETPPGYSIITCYADGRVENKYYPHHF
ncbi:calcineurin-like phosphoesterase family protein [Dyadobacter jejuensis]|uniref:Calcineurin-like phosphoesterase family protein n=1 Tax=Dyadobacter jejuensis TaxID=1082580 RepID=A0A316ALE9_9BACT|nr:metallophosphoesterase [Dyadobacter jejuensis]PWJ57670.1 calcineurin-like phosphoesterase family protein [Dyadobacter jejuensis]